MKEPASILMEEQQQPQLRLKGSISERRSATSNDYIVYLQEYEFDIGLENYLISFNRAKQSGNFQE